jgi:hypothetical protein
MISATLIVLTALGVALLGASIIAPGWDDRWDETWRRRD